MGWIEEALGDGRAKGARDWVVSGFSGIKLNPGTAGTGKTLGEGAGEEKQGEEIPNKEKKLLFLAESREKDECVKLQGILRDSFNDIKCLYFNQKGQRACLRI